MKIANQAYDYAQYQVKSPVASDAQKSGKSAPLEATAAEKVGQQEYDFSNMTLKELSSASHALYEDGTLSLGQHAALSLNYGATKNGLNQASGEVSLAQLQSAENTKVDVIALQKERLQTQMQNGASSTQIQFSKTLINTLESYQYGGGGRFHASA
ncbi:hypothetical protein BGP78_01720 [Pseudoalteromonas sp. MSK9-3]|uniref:hypothetical protein n=1 Tax=Pseudoalteromonas sp. MSK9-3 TaxID=1897633 RepID=UPI000E6BD306|nr:hypothetical protein [Pseudoalteromonas sp. MSK9-3]RJE76990.1 hypothetical protein BGP78_01720 [Pseudoalteromonas sp. MSK9-3]